MPRYHLNQVYSTGLRIEDSEGAEYADLEAAKADAIDSARELMSQRVRMGLEADGTRFDVTDGTGDIVFSLPFHEAIGKGRDESSHASTEQRIIDGSRG